MKKIISLALSVILLLSTILAVPQVFAQSAVSITNTYEEANLTTTNASLFGTNTKVVTKAANIAGGNTTKVAEFQNVCGSLNTNATAVKIYDPSDNDFAAFVPEKNANYKITFEYYAKKGVTYPLECIIYGNTDNSTFKGDKLASAVYIATDDANYASSAWREATVYISTGNKEYKSLSINAEFVGAEGSPSQWVRLDNVKLVQIASNHDSETTTIIAGSDFQHQSGTDEGIEVMDDIFSSINSSGITSADGFFFLGDYDYDSIDNYANTREGLNAVNNKAQEFSPSNTYLLQGNHDNNTVPGISKSGPNDPSSGKYGVYIINEDDYTWKNDDEQTIKNTAQNLVEYLNAKLTANYDKPIFILSHLSLHYSMRTKNDGDGQYANYIFDVLNEAGSKGLNIVFMYGHNHSNGWDDYLGGSAVFLNKGDNILIAQSSKTKFESFKLNFYYLNAGYVGYYGNHNGADDALTMTSIQFNSSEIVFKRYDSQGIHSLKGAGKTNAYKGETGYDPNTTVYASPLTAQLTSVTDSTPLTDVIKSNVTVNTYDESGLTKDKLVGSGIQTINTFSSSGNDTKVLQFNNFSGSSSITGVKIYNPNDSNFAPFVPQKGKTYEISFKYRTYYGNYNDLYINVRGTTGTDLSGDILSNAVVIPKKDANFKDEVWREASIEVEIDKDFTGLAITFEADGTTTSLPRWSMLDDVTVTEVVPESIINTYDESGLTKDKLVGSGIQTINTFSSSGNDTKVLQFNNFSGSSSITGVKIYNPNDSNFASFVPQKGKTYEISFKYRTYYGNYNDLYINVRGTTGTDLSGDILSNAVVIPKKDANFKDEVWREASVKVTIDKDYTGLAIAFEADGLASGTLPRWSMLDDVQVVEAEPDEHQEVGVINTYDNIGLTKDKLVGSGMQTISTFADTGNGTKVLQFNSFSGADGINGVKIYDQNDSNFTAFVPEKNTVYKVEFKYNTYMSNYYALQINVKGTTGNASLAGETLCNAVTIDKADSNYSSEIWRDATAYFNTGDNNYTGIAITFEAVGAESSIPRWSMLDDIKLTVIENATSDIVFHNYVGDGSDKTLTVDNTYTFDNLKTPTADGKKFAGFYLDSTFNTEAKGYIYGVTELWVKWRTANDADKIINTYDDEGVYYAPYGQYGYTRRYSDSDLTNCIDSALAFPHFILGEIAEDVGVDGTKAVWFKSNTTEANKYPSAVRIYDSSSANKELYVPRKNSVYKVSIKYKSTVERYHPVSIVIKGMTDTSNTFGSGVALGTIASIPGSTIVKNWETAECYIVTDNTDFVCFGIYSMTSGGASYNSGGELYIDDVEITEIFDVNTLTLELNGGKGTQSIPFIAGEKPARLPTPEKNGYIFAGWYTDSTLTKVFAIDVMPDEDVTLYAKWEPIVSTAEIFKTGFENDDYDNDVTPYINGKDTNNNTDSAIWEESYDEAYEGERYIHLDNVAYSAVDTPRHAAVALVNPDGSYYQVVEGQRYKFNYAMRTDNYVRIVLAVSDDVPTKGLSVSTTDVQFERHYHILWYHPVETWGEMEEYFTATATGKVYLLTYYHAEYLDIDDITLTPVSEGDANLVEFYNEGGTLISSTLGGSGKLMTAPTPPKKDGYVFDGWRDENGVQYISSNFPTSDMKLYASYRTADNTGDVSGIAGTKNYDFEGEDEKAAAFYGSGTNAYSHDWGEYFVTNDEDGAHSGSSYFYFWNAGVWTKANYSRFRVFDPDSKGNMVYLEPNSVYRIKFWMRVDNIWSGGLWLATMETNELTVINNEYIASLSEADMGDNFGKWIQYEATIITGEEISTLGVELSGGYFTGAFDDFTVEKLSKYTVTFDSNGGSQVESKQAFDGDYIVAPAYPEKDGFIFDGWYADKELTSKFKFNKTPITGNITLYAKWVKVEEQEYKTVITYTQEEQEVANEEYDSAPDEQITVNKNDKIGQVNGENGQFNWWIIIVVAAVVLIAVSTFLIVFIIKKKKKN